ncbi:MAG: hypothetical protein ACRD3Q_16810 [Terriglobales bacterium]
MRWHSFKSAVRGLLGTETRRFAAGARHYHLTNPYHSVSVIPAADACEAARDLRGRRFLSHEAPQLPLRDCPHKGCRCHYKHHDDRRKKRRRTTDRFESSRPWSGVERRRSHGRRVTDLP